MSWWALPDNLLIILRLPAKVNDMAHQSNWQEALVLLASRLVANWGGQTIPVGFVVEAWFEKKHVFLRHAYVYAFTCTQLTCPLRAAWMKKKITVCFLFEHVLSLPLRLVAMEDMLTPVAYERGMSFHLFSQHTLWLWLFFLSLECHIYMCLHLWVCSLCTWFKLHITWTKTWALVQRACLGMCLVFKLL